MPRFNIKQNDTSPDIQSQLVDEDDNPIDFSSGGNQPASSVDFHMIDEDDNVKVNAAGTFENKSEGKVSYSWQSGDTDTTGVFEAEWEVTYDSGAIESFPNSSNIVVVIEEELA